MLIKEIELNNFRIYQGKNKLELLPSAENNIIIVSGKNGYGKTTFLMALVWCLYGKQMQKVDELYSKEIWDKGGYPKYISNSLNSLARVKGETKFSVSITFTDVKIPEVTCSEIRITRSYELVSHAAEKVEILIDGYHNDLIDELGNESNSGEETFIRDFILPIEIAKFFFFDAEKIVSLAEVNSNEQRKQLSKAYSEVLGIKKYEETRERLIKIQDNYRRESAKPKDKEKFNNLITEIDNNELEIEDHLQKIDEFKTQKEEKNYEINQIQEKLIREGQIISLEKLEELKQQELLLDAKLIQLQDELKDIFDIIPFGIAGDLLGQVLIQLKDEENKIKSKFQYDDVEIKVKKILDDLEEERSKSNIIFNNVDVRNFYEYQFERLIKKYFYPDLKLPDSTDIIHDFSHSEKIEFETLVNELQTSFKQKFEQITDSFYREKNQLDGIRRQLRAAEKDAENEYIQALRNRKSQYIKEILEIDRKIDSLNQNIGELKNTNKTLKQQKEELSKKITVSEKNQAKDEKTKILINRLNNFIKNFKTEKKKNLEHRILSGLKTLLHKKEFIDKVIVDIISDDDVDINLYNKRNEKIDKGTLSMGERQMYASALLKALVDESDIDFPIFIDSPMQKFDEEHAQNIINYFYPSVSEQVVILPIINKELTKNEYDLLKEKIAKSYLIINHNSERSDFLEVESDKLISKYEEIVNASN